MRNSVKNPETRKRLLVLAAVLAAAGGIYAWYSAGTQSTDDASIEAHVVSIAPKVAGYVQSMNVLDNQPVKAGDLLLSIDQTDYKIRLDEAQAALEQAEARLAEATHSLETTRVSAPSAADSARSQVEAARANWEKAAADLKRYRSMSEQARSRQQLDDAVATERSAHSALEDAKAKLRTAETAPAAVATAESNVHSLAAAVEKARADVAAAEDDLKHTSVLAPLDGRVARKSVEKGSYVQPGQQLMAVVGNDYWVVANFKESQITHMKPGQPVSIHIDAYPGKAYRGKVDSIQAGTGARFSAFPPENATGNYVKVVQRVPVKIVFEEHPDPQLAVGPGMSVVPTVNTR